MAPPPLTGSEQHSFGWEVDDLRIVDISAIKGLALEQDVIELREAGPTGGSTTRRLPGGWRPGEVTLSRPLTMDNAFQRYVQEAHGGARPFTPRNGALVVYSGAGEELKRYQVLNAWPQRLAVDSVVEADGTSRLIERLTLSYQRVVID